MRSSPIKSCPKYSFKEKGICKDVLGDVQIHKTLQEQIIIEKKLKDFFPLLTFYSNLLIKKSIDEIKSFAAMVKLKLNPEAIRLISKLMDNPARLQQCLTTARKTYCHAFFPKCQINYNTIKVLPLCREACRMSKRGVCKEVAGLVRLFKLGGLWKLQCHQFPERGSHKLPICFYPSFLPQGTS